MLSERPLFPQMADGDFASDAVTFDLQRENIFETVVAIINQRISTINKLKNYRSTDLVKEYPKEHGSRVPDYINSIGVSNITR